MITEFYNDGHLKNYEKILKQMKLQDAYHKSVAYLFSLDRVCLEHIEDLFDFSADCIKPYTALRHGWQTGTSVKTTRLAFNLWNGCTSDYESGGDDSSVSKYYAPDNIFTSEYAIFYFEAIKLRFNL